MIQIDNIDSVNEYLKWVTIKADHHADKVNAVCISLLGAIIWKNEGSIKVREHKGRMKNQIWFTCNNTTYNLSYDHATEKINLKKGRSTIYSFENSSTHEQIRAEFGKL